MADFAPLVYASEVDKDLLRRATLRGDLVRIAAGIYSSETGRQPKDVVANRLWEIVGHQLPGAVIVDRSARTGGRPAGGELYVTSRRSRPLELAGLRIVSRPGAGPLPGDMRLPDGVFLSGQARALLENLAPSRRTASGKPRRLGREEVGAVDRRALRRSRRELSESPAG